MRISRDFAFCALLVSLFSLPALSSVSVVKNYGNLPLRFEPNQGQAAPGVDFVSRGAGYSMLAGAGRMSFELGNGKKGTAEVGLQFLGSDTRSRAEGLGMLGSRSNYFIGNDPSRWQTNIPNFSAVSYPGLYPGINLRFHGSQRMLEYDLSVAPGADPNLIRVGVSGVDPLTLDSEGNLVLHSQAGDLNMRKPVLYQESAGGRQTIAGEYVLLSKNQFGFRVGKYNRRKPLVIDPVLGTVFATLLGGSGDEYVYGLQADSSGNTYLAGATSFCYRFPHLLNLNCLSTLFWRREQLPQS